MFKELIEKGLTSYHESFLCWEDAVKAGSEKLIEKGIIDGRYVDSIIKCINEYGPYIVLFPSVAMPHSTLGCEGVYENGISFMKVEKPVIFNQEDEDSYATLFFTICAIDNDSHLKNISKLAEILGNEEVVEELKKVKNDQELLNITNKYNI